MVALLCIALFTVSAVIVARVVIDKRKRQRKVEEERQRFEETRRSSSALRKRREEEEERRRAQEEQRQKTEKEAQGRAEKEKLEQREAKEDRNRSEEEKQQKTGGGYGGRQLPPINRGGTPRGPKKRREEEQPPRTKLRSLKPEIVCWNEGWDWVIGIEVPEELELQSIAQNEEQLEQNVTEETRYHLKHAEGKVKVAWTGGQKIIPLARPERKYLIFKMRKGWKGVGRLVMYPTTGYYLAIVPQEWNRDGEVSGSAPVAPQSVQVTGYKAHFFYQDKNTAIGFIAVNGERILIESGGPYFQLIGEEIGDASEDMGPLFVKQPPHIRALGEKGWSDVGVIVVGEEGSGRNRWRTSFTPQVGVKEQELPDKLTNRRGGWYFVRIYDNDDGLLESMDFRFMTTLKDIRMENANFLPGPDGYNSVTVQFLHQSGCEAKPTAEDIQHALEIRQESDQTIVTIPPKPDCDKTHWILHDGGAQVEVTVLAERIWWAFGVIEMAPSNWLDKPITLSRKEFTAITDKALWIRFPRLRFIKEIDAGFDRTKIRSYQVGVEKKELVVPLRDFCDAKEIESGQEESRIMIWVQPEGVRLEEAVIAKVPADPPLLREQKQRQVQKIILKKEKDSLLRAIVKHRHGKRKGKGFSKKELTEAGIPIENTKCLHIPYDKRRKTLHSWNVESLKNITER